MEMMPNMHFSTFTSDHIYAGTNDRDLYSPAMGIILYSKVPKLRILTVGEACLIIRERGNFAGKAGVSG